MMFQMVAASCGNRALNVDVGIIDCFSAKIGKIGERGKGIAEKIHEKQGLWEEASGGTLFLDEIGNLPPEVQQMLLRALEAKRYRPTGGSKDKKADVRIITATNEDLQTAIAEKRFRADLYQRLKEYTLHIPPLRECKEDILPLADFFLKLANDEFEKQVKGFDAEARVRMAVLHTEGDTIMANTLEFDENPLAADASLALYDMEKKQIVHALEQAKGNRTLAAALLGIGRTTLYSKMKEYGIRNKE